jgi:hypothetical protein
MADLDDEPDDEDSGVFGAILDLNMGAVAKLECDWCGGPNAHNVAHAQANVEACRAALEKVAALLEVEGKRSQPMSVEAETVK